jgi:hypothetical protein
MLRVLATAQSRDLRAIRDVYESVSEK